MNITLIGMPSAGKSYFGKRLAPRLSLEFVDIDTLLETVFGKPIQTLLDDMGEKRYLEVESEMLINGTSGRSDLLISPGGSVVYMEDTMRHVREISTVVYLMAPFETIRERIERLPPRAIIGLGEKSLQELYNERHPRYQAVADFVVELGAKTDDEVLQEIADGCARLTLQEPVLP